MLEEVKQEPVQNNNNSLALLSFSWKCRTYLLWEKVVEGVLIVCVYITHFTCSNVVLQIFCPYQYAHLIPKKLLIHRYYSIGKSQRVHIPH